MFVILYVLISYYFFLKKLVLTIILRTQTRRVNRLWNSRLVLWKVLWIHEKNNWTSECGSWIMCCIACVFCVLLEICMSSCNDLSEFVLTFSECSMRVWLRGSYSWAFWIVECFFSIMQDMGVLMFPSLGAANFRLDLQ